MKTKVLLIDDNDAVRETLSRILIAAGLDVVEAREGGEGIDKYKSENVDIVVTDILMPGKEGIETILELRRLDTEIKILAISGGDTRDGTSYLSMAEKLGANSILPKPFRSHQLIAKIDELLETA